MNNERTVYGMDMERQPWGTSAGGWRTRAMEEGERGQEGEDEGEGREPANRTKQRNRIIRGGRPYFSCVNFPTAPTRTAAAESPVIALVKSRVMPESVYNTHRFLQIKTWGARDRHPTQQSATVWSSSSADDTRRNGSKSNDTHRMTRHFPFSIDAGKNDTDKAPIFHFSVAEYS